MCSETSDCTISHSDCDMTDNVMVFNWSFLWPSGSLVQLTDKTKKNKTFNKRKNRTLLTLRRSQKHYEIFSNNVLRKTITQKQFKRWLGLVSISQTALGYLVIRTQSKY